MHSCYWNGCVHVDDHMYAYAYLVMHPILVFDVHIVVPMSTHCTTHVIFHSAATPVHAVIAVTVSTHHDSMTPFTRTHWEGMFACLAVSVWPKYRMCMHVSVVYEFVHWWQFGEGARLLLLPHCAQHGLRTTAVMLILVAAKVGILSCFVD